MKTKFKTTKALSLVLALALVLSSFFVLSSVTAYADDDIYIYYDKDLTDQYPSAVKAVTDGIRNYESTINIHDCAFPFDGDLIERLLYVVLYSNPDFFYLKSISYNRLSGDSVVYSISPVYKYDRETTETMLQEFETKTSWYLGKIKNGMSDFEKALTLHDEMILNSSYLLGTDVYDLMVRGKGRCYGYAEAYSYLLAKIGIKSEQVISETMNHQWNKICLDGQWYHVDVTWDDPTPNREGRVSHTYFLLSDNAFPEDTEDNLAHDHYDFTSAFTSDTKYDNYSYHSSKAKICYIDGNLYMLNGSKLVKYNYLTDSSDELLSLNYKWKTSNNGYWNGTFSSLDTYDGFIYYNSPSTIYAYDPAKATVTEVYTKTSGYDFYGFIINDEKLYGLRSETPNESGELEYCADVLENTSLYKTASGASIDLNTVVQREADDTTLTGIGNSFKNLQTLGVQVKKTSYSTTRDIRFVAVINNEILKDADDYGFIAAGSANRETAQNKISALTLDNAESYNIFSCYNSNNMISGDYGKYSADKKYKYVTLAVNNIRDNNVAVKFYVKKGSKTYYAAYVNGSGTEAEYCIANWAALN